MNKHSLILALSALLAVVLVVAIGGITISAILPSAHAGAVGHSVHTPSTSGTGLWEEFVKPSIGAIGAVFAALIAGTFAYRHLLRQLQTQTRNAFLDMLVGTEAYRNDVDRFLTLLYKGDYVNIQRMMGESPALFFLFILKPDVRRELAKEVAKPSPDRERVLNLATQLFT